MARNEKGLNKAIGQIQDLRDDFNKNLLVPGSGDNLNAELERVGRALTFWILENYFVAMLLSVTSPVGDIFVKNIKQRMVKQFEMMKTLHTLPYGNLMVMVRLPIVTKKS